VMRSQHATPCAGDAGPATPGRALLHAAVWILGLAAAAGIVTFAALSLPGPFGSAALHRAFDDAGPALRAIVGLAPEELKQRPESLRRQSELEVTSALGGGTSLSLQKRTAISALASTAMALLALGFALSRALILSPVITPGVRHAAPLPARQPWPRGGATFMARASELRPASAAEQAPPTPPTVLDRIGLSTEQLLAIEPREPDEQTEGSMWRPRPRSNPPATTAKALIEKVLAETHGAHLEPIPGDRSSAAPMLPRGGAPNDLSSYLQLPTALRTSEYTKKRRGKRDRRDKIDHESIQPALQSFGAVVTQVRARAAANTRGEILVAAGGKGVDATGEAIRIARSLLSSAERGVLVDLSRGAAAVSGRLSLPRAPGFADLLAGRVGFDEVIHVDSKTALQVIPAGHPTVRFEGNEIERALGIFDALAQAYDVVVLHADRDGAAQMLPALAGRLSVTVAVLGTGGGASIKAALADLNALGCPVVPYERHKGDEGFGRAASV
jgi:Mrp family chromosome partitioning ATPase